MLLFESDEESRNLERQVASGDLEATIRLANNYLRSNDSRFEELIGFLRKSDHPDAKAMIRLWANQNKIPTAKEFINDLHFARGAQGQLVGVEVLADHISQKAKNAKFWLIEEDESGRGGFHAGVEIWESPAGGKIWIVWESGYEEFNDPDSEYLQNYGVVDPVDHAEAQVAGDILNYYRGYLN